MYSTPFVPGDLDPQAERCGIGSSTADAEHRLERLGADLHDHVAGRGGVLAVDGGGLVHRVVGRGEWTVWSVSRSW